METVRTATCEWCEQSFDTPVRRGRPPSYCRRSHRQRAYEARRNAATSDSPKPAAVDALAAAVNAGDVAQLVDRAIEVVASTGETAPAWPHRTPLRGKSNRSTSRPKPWKVVLHRTGHDPETGELYTAHTTQRAAETSSRQLADIWHSHQFIVQADAWTWSVVDDQDDRLDGPAMSREQARETVGRIVVVPDQPMATVTYRRRVAPHRRDVAIVECVTAGGHTSSLAARMRKSANAYGVGTEAGTLLAEHPYAVDLLYDACNAGAGDLPPAAAKRLAEQAPDMATVILPDGPSWELDAAAIRRWLCDRDVIAIRSEHQNERRPRKSGSSPVPEQC